MRYEVLFMFKDKAAEMTLGAKALRIDMETAFHILRQRDSVPKGMPWSDDFPEVVNHTSSLKARNHPDFEAAKHGDFDAAIRLVDALVSDEKMDDVVQRFPSARIAYIHCKEGLSANMIPAAYASMFAAMGMSVDDDIVAVNRVSHTNSSDLARLSKRMRFDGKVTKGADYILLDDFITTGAELRDLRDYISSKGRIKSLQGYETIILKPFTNQGGYARVDIVEKTIIERFSGLRKDHTDIQEVAREGAKEMTIKEEQKTPVFHFRR